jgi:hypothetical protein
MFRSATSIVSAVSSFVANGCQTLRHVSASPPLIPDGRISRVRLAAAAFPRGPSHACRDLSTRLHTPLGCMVIPPARHPLKLSPLTWPCVQTVLLYGARHLPRAPLPDAGVILIRVVSCTTSEGITPPSSLRRAHAPRRNPLAGLGFRPIQRVFAGCCEPLLGVGGSRRYLHNPCIGAWSHTPP